MALKKLTELHIFNGYPNSLRSKYIREMTDESLLDVHRVQPDMIQVQLSTIQRRFKYSSKAKVLSAFDAGMIHLINDERMTVPSNIPSWLILKNRQIVGVANLSLYSKKTANTEIDIDPKKLYGLMQNAFITLSLYNNYNKMSNNATLIKNMAQAYSRMFIRCLDRLYSLSLEKIQADKAAYLVGKFFLLYIVGKTPNAGVNNIAKSCTLNDTPANILDSLEDEFPMESYDSLETFIKDLGQTVPTLQYVTIRSLLETWTRLYGDSSLLALESLTFFFTTCFSSHVSAGLNNETLIQNMVSRQVQTAFGEFFRLS